MFVLLPWPWHRWLSMPGTRGRHPGHLAPKPLAPAAAGSVRGRSVEAEMESRVIPADFESCMDIIWSRYEDGKQPADCGLTAAPGTTEAIAESIPSPQKAADRKRLLTVDDAAPPSLPLV